MATTATTAAATTATTTPSTQRSSCSNRQKKNESRLSAIQQLLDRYRQEQTKGESGSVSGSGGYYVHPALHYETDEWGGVAAQVSHPVTSGTILLVIPEVERLSFRRIGPMLEPQSLYTHYLPAIKKECETSSSLKESLHCDNIVAALLIMYLWKNGTTTTTSSSIRSSSGTTTTTTTTNLDLFLQTWPSSDELQHLYLQPKDRQPWLQGTYAEYYMQQRTTADGMILDAIFKVFRNKKDDGDSQVSFLLSRFSDDITRAGFAKVFSLAWKIVDSRCHDGLPGTSKGQPVSLTTVCVCRCMSF
jgi:hypothetical protein